MSRFAGYKIAGSVVITTGGLTGVEIPGAGPLNWATADMLNTAGKRNMAKFSQATELSTRNLAPKKLAVRRVLRTFIASPPQLRAALRPGSYAIPNYRNPRLNTN